MQISNLRHETVFADTVAHRGWTAWWNESGVPLSDYRAHLDLMLEEDRIPFALVAHRGDAYVGSVLVIEDDLEARPHYAPWIAALWVDPQYRRQGVAGALITRARQHIATFGHDTTYLCATPEKRPYYLKQGFALLEEDVTGLDVFSIDTP